MEQMKRLIFTSAFASTLFLMGSADALTLQTVGINNYAANRTDGSTIENLSNRVSAANNAGAAFSGNGHTWLYANNETSAYSWLFTGYYPGISNIDVVYFAGHGNPDGPYLGTKPEYTGMYPSNYSWGSAGVRWFFSDCCLNLYDGKNDNRSPSDSPDTWYGGSYPLSRWFQALYWGSGSLHGVFGMRSDGWDMSDFGKNCFNRALGNGQAVGQAWFDSVAEVAWNSPWYWPWYHPTQGVEPAALCSGADSKDYFNENMKAPWLNPGSAPNNGYVNYHWSYLGTPKFF